MKSLLKNLFHIFFPSYFYELKKVLSNCESLLDVGCGSFSPIASFSKSFYSVGVDAFVPSIEKSRKLGIHNKYYNIDVLDIGKKFKENSFDCVLASDLIEHLSKEDGFKLIEMMEKIAKKKVVIFTPNGFLPQGEYNNNPWQVHKSGWSVEEMRRRGYKVIGINGWKPLRGERARIKYKPKLFWLIFSILTIPLVRNHPTKAFQILCVKTFDS